LSPKPLFQNKFLAILDQDGYTYVHEVRCNGVIVVLLPYRTDGAELRFLARLEICPAHGPEMERCSITGGLEPNKTVVETAQLELWEEAGYQVELAELIPLGHVRPSKAMDTTAYLFGVDVTGKTQTILPTGDGSRFEVGSSVEWVDYEQGIQINDPLFVTALTRLLKEIKNGNRITRN